MKNTLLAIALISTLPVVAIAQEADKPVAKEHHMQNTQPEPKKAEAPEHVMRNDAPSPKHAEPKPEHVMKNN